MPSAFARSADITTAAAAPSEVCEELPAVTVPLAWKDGLERQQRLEGSVGTRAFVHFESDLLTLRLGTVRSGETDRHGDSFVVELAGLNCRQRFLVAAQ